MFTYIATKTFTNWANSETYYWSFCRHSYSSLNISDNMRGHKWHSSTNFNAFKFQQIRTFKGKHSVIITYRKRKKEIYQLTHIPYWPISKDAHALQKVDVSVSDTTQTLQNIRGHAKTGLVCVSSCPFCQVLNLCLCSIVHIWIQTKFLIGNPNQVQIQALSVIYTLLHKRLQIAEYFL